MQVLSKSIKPNLRKNNKIEERKKTKIYEIKVKSKCEERKTRITEERVKC